MGLNTQLFFFLIIRWGYYFKSCHKSAGREQYMVWHWSCQFSVTLYHNQVLHRLIETKGAHNQAKNYVFLTSPCLARESATMLAPLPLWLISRLSHLLRAFRMKFSWKFRFHGPPTSSLHHLTALTESDSMMMECFLMLSLLIEIWIARYMASISAQFISIGGIGLDNMHLKLPRWSRRTSPIADDSLAVFTDASTFHFCWFLDGGSQDKGWANPYTLPTPWCWSFHERHVGFLMISSLEYGKGSPQPFIHQLNRRSTRSCSCGKGQEEFLKILAFLSFHTVQMMTKKLAIQTFLKNFPALLPRHWSYASRRVCGKTQLVSHKFSHQYHSFQVRLQWRSRWLWF